MHGDSTNYIRKVSHYQAEKNMHNSKTNCLQRQTLPHAGITMLIPQQSLKIDSNPNKGRKIKCSQNASFSYRHVAFQRLLRRDSNSNHDAANGSRHRRRPHPSRGAIQRASAESRRDAVPDVVGVPRRHDPALDAGVEQANDAEAVAPGAPGMTGGVEDAVDAELGGVTGLEGLYPFDEAETGTADGAGEVATSGVEGEVLAPGSTLAASLLDEEILGGGW